MGTGSFADIDALGRGMADATEMAMTQIEVPPRYRVPTLGEATISVEGDTVRACIEAAEAQYPGFGELVLDRKGEIRRFVKLFVNGDELARDAIDSAVSGDDTISVLTAAAGG